MYRRFLTLSMVWLMSVLVLMVPRGADAQEKITGPWLWMIAPTEAGQGGAASTDVDSLAVASGGAVTEADVAANGADVGGVVGNYAWTLSTIRNSGIINTGGFQATEVDNVTDVLQRIGWANGDVNDHTSYALITLESINAQNNVTMRVGSDDAIKVWLNGQVVHTNAINRGTTDFQDNFPVNLRAGDNLLLVKVSERGGNWGMFVGIDANVTAVYKPPTSGLTDAYVYWASWDLGSIQRAKLDGTNLQNLVTGLVSPRDVALDIARNKMYWVDSEANKIQRANLDGTNVEDLINTQGRPLGVAGVAIDTIRDKLYWSAWGPGKIRRANLDGTNVEDFVTGLSQPEDIAFDLSAGKIYWADTGTNKIQRANLNGSNVEDLVTVGLSNPLGIALDVAAGKMYWTNTSFWSRPWPGHDKIQRANLDGTNVEDLVTTGLHIATGIALDISAGKMYWSDVGKIQRANLDGSNVEDAIVGNADIPIGPSGITLGIPQTPDFRLNPNLIADQTFTLGTPVSLNLPIATGGVRPYTYNISTLPPGLQFDPANIWLNGTPSTVVNAHPVTYTVTDAAGASESLTFTITVQDTPSLTDVYMYWASWSLGSIQRAKLDGTNLQDLVTGLTWPRDIALDIAGNKMYWVDAGANKVQRANLDGTNVEDLVNLQGRPFGVAVDAMNGKLYWAVWGPGKIQRANLDGTNVEDFVTGLSEPEDIDLDLSRGKIYWTDTITNKIQRANLDGSNIEDLVTVGLSHPLGLALDVTDGKIYWTNTSIHTGPWPAHDKIQRANLDGTNVEDLVTTGLSTATGIALDISAGKMYWSNTGKIQRANLDGSNVEDAIVGSNNAPIAPTGIALGIPQTPSLRLNPNVIADQTFVVNTPIQPLDLPLAEGGTQPYTYTLAPIPAGLSFNAGTLVLSGAPTTVGDTVAIYTATDTTGASASLTFTITVEANLDVNGDGKVDILDLVWVAVSYGLRGPNLIADVNADGVINIQDLVAVAGGIDAAAALPTKIAEEVLSAAEAAAVEFEAGAGAPVIRFNTPSQTAASGITVYGNIAAALADAKALASRDVRLGKWVPLLEELLQVLVGMGAIPETTALLPNYPNPFNPETWIPYHLAQAANVTLTIYDVRGSVVRELTLGHQPAGVYENRGRAAYWNGKNALGESVASGVYFYTLTAGEFTATRKLLIAK